MAYLRVVRKRIGELLLERHIITPEQLAIAIEEQKNKAGYLSQHLIALGFTTEQDIVTCISNQYNIAYLPLKNYTIPQGVLSLIPLKWIKVYTLLPVDKMSNVLSVVMADPLNEGVIQMLRQICNCEIAVFISTYSELNDAINRCFGEQLKDLEKHHIDAKDLEKVKTATQFIQSKAYLGPDRRVYIRVRKALDIVFYYHAMTFQGKTEDISYGGVSFVSESQNYGGLSFVSDIFMPLNTSLACKVYLQPDQPPIDVVVSVIRVQAMQCEVEVNSQRVLGQKYGIAGMFEFIANEDRKTLLAFLKENIP